MRCIVYIVTQFASRANRRNHQLLSLVERGFEIVLVKQADQNNPHTYYFHNSVVVKKLPDITGILKLFGLHKWRWQLQRQLYFPSTNILYVKAAQRMLKKQIWRDLQAGHPVSLITLTPPHDLALIGLHLKKVFPKLHWIVDWQDLWTYDPNYQAVPEQQSKIRELERNVLLSSDMNIVTTANAQAVLQSEYGIPVEKTRVIQHAYDPEEIEVILASLQESEKTGAEPLTIGFLGSLFKPPKVPGQEVIRALKAVRARGFNIEFHIFGDKYLDKVSRQPVQNLQWIKVHQRTGHLESLRNLISCDVFLLVLADLPVSQTIMHMKLPFYLALGRPILAIVPDRSAVADIIRETKSGFVIPADQDWTAGLEESLAEYLAGSVAEPNREAIEQFSWQNICGHWEEVILNKRLLE